jgi:hypothetical protein
MNEGRESNGIDGQPDFEVPQDPETTERQHFPTADELADSYIAEFGIEDKYGDIRHEIKRAILYERAGRNLSNLGHHISEKLHRPVLALNNPRAGALYQIGFNHWLENFGSREKADQFLTELESNRHYEETLTHLNEQIEKLRQALVQLRDVVGESLPELSTNLLNEIIGLPDPSIDIRLEQISTQTRFVHIEETRRATRASRRMSEFFHNSYPEHRQYIDEYLDWLDSALLTINSIKDHLRSMIFRQASEWLQTGQIESFVYPVNHWKLSSNGPKEIEIDRYGQAKLYETVAQPETFVLFSDAKTYYWREPEQLKMRSGMRREFQGGTGRGSGYGQGSFANVIRGSQIISEALEYPLSPHAPHALASTQKRLLGMVEADTKVLDVQGLFPDQDDEKRRGSSALESETSEISIDPSILMQHSEKSQAVARVVEELQDRPEWLNDLKSRIPLESNYGYNGPEEAS